MSEDGYVTKIDTVVIGPVSYRIRSLLDRCQFSDPDGVAAARGITDASWPYFGQLWPAEIVLADAMQEFPFDGQRMIEIGCGLALAGIVAHRRHVDVSVSDRHPLGPAFLRENLRLNGLPHMSFHEADWQCANPALGRFDLIIASDVLYEPVHAQQLMRFIERHAAASAEVVIVDPGRRRLPAFTRLMTSGGFAHSEQVGATSARMRIARYRL